MMKEFMQIREGCFRASLALVVLISISGIGGEAMAESAAAARQSPRIVGGVVAPPEATQWVAAILSRNEPDPYQAQFCGGSLIAADWVLTAAHCMDGEVASGIDVLVGQSSLSGSGGYRIQADQIIRHSGYSSVTLENDIALIHLSTPAPITPMQLPGPTPIAFHGEFSLALGWGDTSGGVFPNYPYDLMMAPLVVLGDSYCSSAYPGEIFAGMMCAAYPGWTKDTCQGDSGGPLVTASAATGGQLTQIGVTSWGSGCAQAGAPGVYSRVSSYAGWVSDQICGPGEAPPAPTLDATLIGTSLSVDISPLPGATGYRLYWAPWPTLAPISQLNLGATTSLDATLPSNAQLVLMAQAYNGNCQGDFSATTTVGL